MLTGTYLLLAIAAAVLLIVISGTRWGWHPFFSLLISAVLLALLIGISPLGVVEVITAGFGQLVGSVGLLIVLGSIIGVALERSGAALRIADLILGKGTAAGLRLTVLGAIVSVPVFCDSGFILLAGLLPAIASRTKLAPAVPALSLAGGLYLTHTLVPPTPGPLAAAANLGADAHLGTLLLLSVVVAIPVIAVVWRAAEYLGRGVAVNFPAPAPDPGAEMPSAWRSVLPIALPIVLIATGSLLAFLGRTAGPWAILSFFCQPTVALLLGCLPALSLPGSGERREWIGEALSLAGPILVITGLGGAFGAVLRASSLSEEVAGWMGAEPLSGYTLLMLGFGVAALLKTAQGSSTGALVIASSVLAPLLPLAGFTDGTSLALLTLSIGSGAMTVSHANDSYFWVVTKFSGIEIGDAYRSYTLMTGVIGLSAFLVILILYGLLG